MTCVNIDAKRKYPVYIGNGILSSAGTLARKNASAEKALLVTDNRVAELYMDRVKESLEDAGYETFFFVFVEGEQSKNPQTLVDLLETAANLGLTRGDIFVALGGGVTGDLCGLAASLYMRGVRFVQIPTTLLAAVDSSVGGKTAVDLEAGKNLCGTFWQPSCVICDPETLDTLAPNVYSDGMAEVIKYGAICDADLFDMVKTGDTKGKLSEIIERCVRHKAEVVHEDEFDTGRRAILNFGHTFGHSIEKLSEFSISHGSAVAVGMCIAARASENLGLCDSDVHEKIVSAVKANGLPNECTFSADAIAEAALSDKKRAGATVSLILLQEIGECLIRKTAVADMKSICEKAIK